MQPVVNLENLKKELIELMKRYGANENAIYTILFEMEMDGIDDTYLNDRPWLK